MRRLAFAPTDPLAVRQWYIEATHAFGAWDQLPPLAPVRVAVIDSGHRSLASGSRAEDRGGQELRRRQCAGHPRARDDRRGDHRGRAREQHGDRGARARGGAARCEGRRRQRDDLRRSGGEGDPLGRRSRRAGDQHLARRAPRPRRPEPRYVLAARAAGDRLRRPPQRRRGRSGRQRRPGAAHAVALRELPGRASARPRRECPRAERRVADVLEPRRRLQRRRRARRRRLLDLPAQAHRRSARVPGPGIHAVRDRPVPAAGGHVVRGAAGDRGRRRHPRRSIRRSVPSR